MGTKPDATQDNEVKIIHGLEVFYADICSSCEDRRRHWPLCQEGCSWWEEYQKCELGMQS
jgi:hypothetical protein